MHKGVFRLVVVLVMQGFILLGLFAAADAARKKVVKIAYKEQETLDPHASILGQTQSGVRLLYRGLTRFAIKEVTETAPDGTEMVRQEVTTTEVEPDLAESWTVSDDGTVWTFKPVSYTHLTLPTKRIV